jgi:hypothetical protein
MTRTFRPLLIVALLATALSGCAPMAVKDITADRTGYLEKNFTPALLSADTGKTIAGVKIAPRFSKATVEYKYEIETNLGEKKVSESSTIQYEDLGNGVIREMAEYFNNGIPVSTSYELRYGGFLPLRTQRVFNANRVGNLIVEVKQFKSFDKNFANMQENSKYDADWASGNTVQIMNFFDRKQTCTTGKAYAANTVNAAFAGNAVDVDCELSFNGNLDTKQQFIYLQQYGFAVARGMTVTSGKIKAAISSVKLQ